MDEEKKKHILFVDDEPRILDGLKRMLRSYRKEWVMNFVEGGPEAIEELQIAIALNPEFKDQGEYYINEIQAGRNP